MGPGGRIAGQGSQAVPPNRFCWTGTVTPAGVAIPPARLAQLWAGV
jgi:hypothetical protein